MPKYSIIYFQVPGRKRKKKREQKREIQFASASMSQKYLHIKSLMEPGDSILMYETLAGTSCYSKWRIVFSWNNKVSSQEGALQKRQSGDVYIKCVIVSAASVLFAKYLKDAKYLTAFSAA